MTTSKMGWYENHLIKEHCYPPEVLNNLDVEVLRRKHAARHKDEGPDHYHPYFVEFLMKIEQRTL